MQKSSPEKNLRPAQHQRKHGKENEMDSKPIFDYPDKTGSGRLENKLAVITGGDSGIGKAVAVLFAREGADICISYLNEHKDAEETKSIIGSYRRKCLAIVDDISKEMICKKIMNRVQKEFRKVDILVNKAAIQFEQQSLNDISARQLQATFATNRTPLITDTFDAKKVAEHGSDSPMKRAGEPVEVAPSYLFLATDDSYFITEQVIHPNGGEIVNG